MSLYQIEITEALSRLIQIEAANAETALAQVENLYKSGDIVLDTDDFVGEPEISLFPKTEASIKDAEFVHHMAQIIAYLEQDEYKDYEQNQYPRNHIYHSIAYIKRYIHY